MASTTADWKAKEGLAARKGATVQELVAMVGEKRLEIDVAPWGEGHLKVNGREIAHVDDAKERTGASSISWCIPSPFHPRRHYRVASSM
jgi:enoyl-[acyl-carrier protein] reductase I